MMARMANTPSWDTGCDAVKARELQHRWSSRWALEGIYSLVGGMAQLNDFRHRGSSLLQKAFRQLMLAEPKLQVRQ